MSVFDKPRRRPADSDPPPSASDIALRVDRLERSHSLAAKAIGAVMTLVAGGSYGLYHSAQVRGERIGAAMVRLDHLERDVAEIRSTLTVLYPLLTAPRAHGVDR